MPFTYSARALAEEVVTGKVAVSAFLTWCANTGAARDTATARTAQAFRKAVRGIKDLRNRCFGENERDEGNIGVIGARGDERHRNGQEERVALVGNEGGFGNWEIG